MNPIGTGLRALLQRFSAQFLYGTAPWNSSVRFALVFALALGFGTGALLATFEHTRADFTAIFILSGSALVLTAGALLYLGARRATRTRTRDAERVSAAAQRLVAEKLHEAFSPQLPVLENLGFSATYIPASTGAVGGDWYDAFELPDGRIMFSIGDVAGHGVDAAVTMSRARQAIVAAALGATDPGRVFEIANLSLMLQDTKFATALFGYIDPRTLKVSYASAGHPPGIMVDAGGSARELSYDGLPLGVAHDASYPSFDIQAEHGALLVLYTDGLLEYDRDLLAGERRILAAVSEIALRKLDNPAAAIRDAIFAGYKPTDDVAIMTIAFAQHPSTGSAGGPQWSVGFRGVRAPLTSTR